MNAIEEIETKLQKYPQVNYEIDGSGISVFPTSDKGFVVSYYEGVNFYTVFYNGWHEDFEDKTEALNCFVFGLSYKCRLVEFQRGDVTYKWTVEFNKNNEWFVDSTTSLLFFPFWSKKEVRYLQNNLLLE